MTQSLLDFILNLLSDGGAKAAFLADPERALADAGLSDVCGEDVSDAMSYVAEYHPVSFVGPREYTVGNNAVAQHATSGAPEGPGGEWHGDPHASAVQRLEYITNNYSYADSHDTVIDKSVNQTVWNKGVLAQSFDDHSVTAADHSVAAGRDISGEVANGDGNVTGDGNDVGNTSYRDDHSINDSFNGNNIADHGGVAGRENQVADHGGVAGNNNDGNATNPDHSAVATTGGHLDTSTNDSHDVRISDSFQDSHDEAYTRTDTDSHDDNSHSAHISEKNYQSFNDESFDHHNDNGQSFNDGSALSDTHQAGLVNLNASPAAALPVEGNHVDVIHPA